MSKNYSKKEGLGSLIFIWVLILLLAVGTFFVVKNYTDTNSKIIKNDDIAIALSQTLDKPAGKITEADLANIERAEFIVDGYTYGITMNEDGTYSYDFQNLVEMNNVTLYLNGYDEASEKYYAEGVTEEQQKSLVDPNTLVASADITDAESALDLIKYLKGVKGLSIYDYDTTETETVNFADIAPEKLEEITVYGFEVAGFENVKNFANLTSLVLYAGGIEDYSVVSGLTKLENLSLTSENITNASFIENMTSLKSITLDGGKLEAIPSLEKLTNLETVDFANNGLTDISALSVLDAEKITNINITGNNIEDFSAIAHIDEAKVTKDEPEEATEEATEESAETTEETTEAETEAVAE